MSKNFIFHSAAYTSTGVSFCFETPTSFWASFRTEAKQKRCLTTNSNLCSCDPIVGRMFNSDPFVANPNSSQDYNRYSYVRNNPLRYTDPSGFMGVGMQKTYHYRIMDFAAINGKLATDCHDAILQMKMMGQKGVESQYLEALLWAEQSEGGEGSGSPGGDDPISLDELLNRIVTFVQTQGFEGVAAFAITVSMNLPTGSLTLGVLYINAGDDKGWYGLWEPVIGAQFDLSAEASLSCFLYTGSYSDLKKESFSSERIKVAGGYKFLSASISYSQDSKGNVLIGLERSLTGSNYTFSGGINYGKTYVFDWPY